MEESELLLNDFDISPQQFSILALVSSNPSITQARVINNLYISRSTCAELIEQLVQKKFVKRTPLDRRSYALTITRKGDRCLSDATKVVLRKGRESTAHMTRTELEQLIQLLIKLVSRGKA